MYAVMVVEHVSRLLTCRRERAAFQMLKAMFSGLQKDTHRHRHSCSDWGREGRKGRPHLSSCSSETSSWPRSSTVAGKAAPCTQIPASLLATSSTALSWLSCCHLDRAAGQRKNSNDGDGEGEGGGQ